MIIQDVQQKILQAADQHVIQEVAVIQPKIITVVHGHGQHVPNLVEVVQDMNIVPAQRDQHMTTQQHVQEQQPKNDTKILHVTLKVVTHAEVIMFIMIADLTLTVIQFATT